mmetsp:Transcript_11303/g.29104  ORF Transcript_11303/g.29104 Transcript_11303/m.29104 type:complete len:286 (+) Transcript_11303:789-1646(+)
MCEGLSDSFQTELQVVGHHPPELDEVDLALLVEAEVLCEAVDPVLRRLIAQPADDWAQLTNLQGTRRIIIEPLEERRQIRLLEIGKAVGIAIPEDQSVELVEVQSLPVVVLAHLHEVLQRINCGAEVADFLDDGQGLRHGQRPAPRAHLGNHPLQADGDPVVQHPRRRENSTTRDPRSRRQGWLLLPRLGRLKTLGPAFQIDADAALHGAACRLLDEALQGALPGEANEMLIPGENVFQLLHAHCPIRVFQRLERIAQPRVLRDGEAGARVGVLIEVHELYEVDL